MSTQEIDKIIHVEEKNIDVGYLQYELEEEYAHNNHWFNFFNDMSDVGWMIIILYCARGLSSDNSYCIFELDNEIVYSSTAHRSYNPQWKDILTLRIKDITSILKITVIDAKNSDILGHIDLFIHNINSEETRWYALRDGVVKDKATDASILLEMHVYYNIIKASIQAISPNEKEREPFDAPFSRYTLARNWTRFRVLLIFTMDLFTFIRELFACESAKKNTIAITIWVLFWWLHDTWMIPLLLLIPFVVYRPKNMDEKLGPGRTLRTESIASLKMRRRSLIQKINSLTEMIQSIQNGIGYMAGIGESVKNLFNFTVPFLSYLAILFIILVSLLSLVVSPRYLFIAWGIKQYALKIIDPRRKPNNEILDLLSRSPDDATVQQCEELPPLDLPRRENK